MRKYVARILVEHRFTFKSDKMSIKELEKEAEQLWNNRVELGLEGDLYHDTEVNVTVD